jgi:tetratricopeptide (TPR) repeat protein
MLDKGNHINVLHLDRLPETDIRAMVIALAEPYTISEQTLRLIIERSDGVPIFATELTRSIISKDGFSPFLNDKAIPQSLSEILLVRLDRLEHSRKTVEQAAVLGREFEVSLLRACTHGIDENIETALDELINAQLFIQHETPNENLLSFDHALVRDAVYQRMLRSDRERLHAKAASVLEQQFETSNKAQPHILAMHYAESGNLERAVRCWQRAGDLAINQLAHHEAFSSYNRGLNLLADLPPSEARDNAELDLCIAIAEPLIALRGSSSRKLAHLAQRAQELCQSTGNQNHLTSVHYLKWTVVHGSSDMQDLHNLATKITEVNKDNEVVRLLGYRAMGFTYMIQGKQLDAYEAFTKFFQLFDYEKYAKSVSFQFSSMNDISGSALAMATICLLRKRTAEANQWRDRALAWALRSHNHVAICQSLIFSGGFISGLQHKSSETIDHMTQAHHYAEKHQLSIWTPYIELSLALGQLMMGALALNKAQALMQASTSIDVLIAQNGPYLTVWTVMYARACLSHEAYEKGLDALNRVEMRVQSGERYIEPEYLRLLANFKFNLAHIDAATYLETLEASQSLAMSQGSLTFLDAISEDILKAEDLLASISMGQLG